MSKNGKTASDGAKEVIDQSIINKGGKKSIHPKYRMINIKGTNGNIWQVCSTYSQDMLVLNNDPDSHPAWTGQSRFVDTSSSHINKFSKYGDVFGDVDITNNDIAKK